MKTKLTHLWRGASGTTLVRSVLLISLFLSAVAMAVLAITPATNTPSTNLSPTPQSFPTSFASNSSSLPPVVALPPGAQFIRNNNVQGGNPADPLGRLPGMLPGLAMQSPILASQQPAPPSTQQPAPSQITSSATAAGNWSITPSPDVTTTETPNSLSGVTCVTQSDCWAVGTYHNGTDYVDDPNDHYQTLIEHWNGTSWTIVNSPKIGRASCRE